MVNQSPQLIPCVHLDYTRPSRKGLEFFPSHKNYPPVQYYIKHDGDGISHKYSNSATKIQFCKKYDKEVSCIFSCYDGSFKCYEPTGMDADSFLKAPRETQIKKSMRVIDSIKKWLE